MLNLIFVFSFSTIILVSESVDRPSSRYYTSSYTDDYYQEPYPNKRRIDDDQDFLCGENEVYDSCKPIYPPLRCNVEEVLTVCRENPRPGSRLCEPGCRCADNYYLNASGDCITEEECRSGMRPSKCNSKSPGYSECINGACRKWRCAEYGYVCSVKGPCEVGCACQDSYKRSGTGICMPAEPCPRPQVMYIEEETSSNNRRPNRPQYSRRDLEATIF